MGLGMDHLMLAEPCTGTGTLPLAVDGHSCAGGGSVLGFVSGLA